MAVTTATTAVFGRLININMKKLLLLSLALCTLSAHAEKVSLNTPHNSFVINLDKGAEPQFLYYGPSISNADMANLQKLKDDNWTRSELYPAYGATHTMNEICLAMRHADGNLSTNLVIDDYSIKPHTEKAPNGESRSGQLLTITLKDALYATTVHLYYLAYNDLDMLESWTDITNGEKKTVTLTQFYNPLLPIRRGNVHVTHFHGSWASEAQLVEEPLNTGLFEIKNKDGLRNATTTCIAPTGTISMIAGASGGIEPLFGLVFSRLILDGTEMLEINPIFKDYMITHGIYSKTVMSQIAKDGTIAHVDGVSEDVKHIFETAHDISPYWHVKMQAAFQLHTDNAVSKTVNFVESATKEDIRDTYILAYKNNLKGITVYRNNSRQFQPMNINDKKKESVKPEPSVKEERCETEEYNPTGEIKKVTCPECGNTIEMAEGCFICLNCGYSGCS